MTGAVLDRSIARTADQRTQALALANGIRFARARMKKQLVAGSVDAVDLILDPPDYLESMKVWKFLMAIPKIGATAARRMMLQARISESKTVGGMSPRQRGELAQLLAGRTSRG